MRIRTGHGPKDWRDIGEGYAGSIPLRGSLVVGGPATPSKPLTWNQRSPEDQAAEDRRRAMAYERTKRYRHRQKDAA